MKILNRETAFEGEHLRIIRKVSISKEDKSIIWETVERPNLYHSGAAMVIGLTDKEELILEKQWRAATESYVIQLPGGLTDIEGESEEECAQRELFEETGYIANRLIPIALCPAFPVLTSMRDRYYFAPDVKYKGGNKTDIAEDIEIITVPVGSLYKLFTDLPDDTELDLRVPGIIWLVEKMGLL